MIEFPNDLAVEVDAIAMIEPHRFKADATVIRIRLTRDHLTARDVPLPYAKVLQMVAEAQEYEEEL